MTGYNINSDRGYKQNLVLSDFDHLIEKGLVRVKDYPDQNLCVLKYHNKVFYKNLWSQGSLLSEARGHVFDTVTGECVSRPFNKVFNYGERNTGFDMLGKDVVAVKKVNGFLGVFTVHNGQPLFSTTGTLDSDFANLFRTIMERDNPDFIQSAIKNKMENTTFLFEVCDESDPHIVPEESGLYLIGIRNIKTGEYQNQQHLSMYNRLFGFKYRDIETIQDTLVNVIKRNAEVEHEGFMIYDKMGKPLLKTKSPYYLFNKLLARMNAGKLTDLWETTDLEQLVQERFGEEYQVVLDKLRHDCDKEFFVGCDEQTRLNILRELIKECAYGC